MVPAVNNASRAHCPMAEEPEILNPQKERDWTGQRVARICGPLSRGIARVGGEAQHGAVSSERSRTWWPSAQ
jgi:hypothetical protein